MTFKRPPRLAAWLLKHLGCSPNNEAVLGDLCERYQQNQSARWYWQQAWIAIALGFFKETWGYKRHAMAAIITGWLVLFSIFFVCEKLAGSPVSLSHHACTFMWFIAGSGSGFAITLVSKRPKRPMVQVYIVSILLFLIGLHPKPADSYTFYYWLDTAVLMVSIVLGALPISSPAHHPVLKEETTC